MAKSSEQKIEIRPGTLQTLMADVANGRYRIPQFQREFVWERPKVVELFDSIFSEYPIGSIFLWRAGREHNDLFRHSVDLNIPPVNKDDDITYILDGQQRVTSLYVTLNGLSVNGTDYGHICFDLAERCFVARAPDNARHIAVCDIWGANALGLMRKVNEKLAEPFDRCFRVLRTYPISIVEVREMDLPSVCRIFQRINQSGKRLDRFDLIAAMTFSKDFDLRQRFKEDILDPLDRSNFGEISAVVVTQLMALLKNGACTQRHEFSLTASEIRNLWDPVVKAVLLAADTLRKGMGVVNAGYLPYEAILTVLAYYFAKSGNKSLSSAHHGWVSRWFWRASFAQWYGQQGPTRMGQDRELIDKLIQGGEPAFDPHIGITVQHLVGTKMSQQRSALRNAFLCLLATRNPRHLINNSPLDLVSGSISDFTSAEKHHIFPHAFLKRGDPAGAEVHALPNFCFLPAELNKRISDSEPAIYFPELGQENPKLAEAADTHMIPFGPESGIKENDYLKFLQARGRTIVDEIGRLCGTVSTPRKDERLQSIESIENRLRDCIDGILRQAAGQNYWKSSVPQLIREAAQKRIDSELKKYPDRKAEELQGPRAKLDYCNVMDYTTIIENGANWAHFSPVFRRKDHLQGHLEAFSEYRNAVMHNRKMSELVQKAGETAMIWLENVLLGSPNGESALPMEDDRA